MRFYSTALLLLLVVFGTCDLRAGSQGFLQTGSTISIRSPQSFNNADYWTSNFYDQQGNAVKSVTVVSNYDGISLDYRQTTTCTFDKQGELLTSLVETDYGFDGTVNSRETTIHTRLSDTQTRDVTESDWGNDGVTDVTDIVTQTFDKEGRMVRFEEEQVYYTNPIHSSSVQTWTFIEDKNTLVTLGQYDLDGDGVFEGTSKAVGIKNQRGQIISNTIESDFDGDGIVDITDQFSISYDKRGNETEFVWAFGGDFGGLYVVNFSYENRGAVRQQSRAENQAIRFFQQTLHGRRGLNLPL
jgi:hypothetical protein